jgi:hypothetical protein
MATYLQGVTDYIPEFQPFQPDLNFYGNVLQTKQTQYDNNWKAINNIYGQYFYADLTRENNIKKKDELMKQIDFNLKRVSGLDLSLDQNVQQATQVFKPFYTDDLLMKDMAWTKNYSMARQNGIALKNSKDKEDQGMYWDTGIRYMDYMRDDFKKVSDDESLNFANVTYTPYVNSMKEFQKLAKEYGDITTEHMSDDGRYLIREKNGRVLIAPLTSLFEASVANDPRMADVYRVQAIVNRKDHIASTKDTEFKGDESAAERAYLTQQNKTIQEYVRRKKDQASEKVTVTDNNIADGKLAVQTGNDNPMTFDYLTQLQKAQGVYQAAESRVNEIESQVSNGSSTMVTSGYIPDDQLDIEALRSKVDVGTAAMLMDQDIVEAANLFAYRNHETKMTADQFALESVRQQNRYALQKKQEEIDYNKMAIEEGLKTQYYLFDNTTGTIIKNPKYQQTSVKRGAGASGGTTDPTSAPEENARIEEEQTMDYGASWLSTVAQILGDSESASKITKERLANILTPFSWDTDASFKNVHIDPKTKQVVSDKTSNEPWFNAMVDYNKRKLGVLGSSLEVSKRKTTEAALKMWKQNPAAYVASLDSKSLKAVKGKVDAFLLERHALGDPNATQLLAGQDNVNMDILIMGKESDELIEAHNKKILVESMKGSLPFTDKNSTRLIDLYYNNGNPLSEGIFKNFAKTLVAAPEREIWAEVRDYSMRGFSNMFESRDPEEKGSFANKQKYNINTMYQAGALTPTNIDIFMKRDLMHNLPKEQYVALRKEILATQEKNKQLDKKRESGAKLTGEEYYSTPKNKRNINDLIESFAIQQNNWDDMLSQTYQSLSSALSKDIVSTKMLSKSNLIDYGKEGSKYSLAATDYSGQEVNTSVIGTLGYNAFQQMMNQDLAKATWITDQNTYRVSWDGTTRSGFEPKSDSEDGENPRFRAQVTDMILRGLQSKIGKESIDFGLYQAQIANEHRGTGAMIVYPTYEFLKSMDLIGTDKAPKMITESQARRIVTNGLAIAGPRSTWKNDIFMDNKTSPAEGVLNALGKIEYEDPMGGGGYIVKKTDGGPSKYSVIYTTVTYDDYTGEKIVTPETISYTEFGKNLDEALIKMRFMLSQRAQKNMNEWRMNPTIRNKNQSMYNR